MDEEMVLDQNSRSTIEVYNCEGKVILQREFNKSVLSFPKISENGDLVGFIYGDLSTSDINKQGFVVYDIINDSLLIDRELDDDGLIMPAYNAEGKMYFTKDAFSGATREVFYCSQAGRSDIQ